MSTIYIFMLSITTWFVRDEDTPTTDKVAEAVYSMPTARERHAGAKGDALD
jgi:hypothetical protein